MTKDGESYISTEDAYSVADYAYNQLGKGTSAEKLKKLCANLLRYGAAAQEYKSYRTDALADSKLTTAQQAYLVDLETVTFGNYNRQLGELANATVQWVGKSLILDSKITLRYVVNVSKYSGNVEDLTLRVTYKDYKGEEKTMTIANPQPYGSTVGR
jgi:hypothetical protein